MDKALIVGLPTTCNSSSELEKAAENYVVKRLGVDDGHPLGQTGRHITMMAFIDGATWQIEQLIQTIKDNSEYDPNKERFYITSNLIHELSLGNLPESKKYETKELYKTDELSEREQLIKELKNWLPRGLQRIDIEVLLEKLEELEK